MTYTAAAALLSNGKASAQQIDTFMANRGHALAADYAPDGHFHPIPDGFGAALIAECRRYADAGVVANWDLISGQVADETAGLQSRYWLERWNPGGIGAINSNPDLATHFPNMGAGLRAHLAHYLDYTVGFGPWSDDDVRYDAVRAAGWLGVCHQLSDLGGRWAYPGTTYGQAIAELANQLLATETPMTAQIPGFTWHPADSRHFTAGRTQKIIGFAVHYTDGVNSLDYLSTNPDTNVSATFLIRRNATLDDRGWQLVKIEDTAHTTGSIVNPKTISFEYEHMEDQDIPAGDYAVMAQTIADCRVYLAAHPELGAFSLTRQDVKGHKEWVGDDRTCPNGISVDRIVAEAASHGVIIPPADDALVLTGPDGKPWPFAYRRGFAGYVRQIGGARYPSDMTAGILSVFGYPLGEEYRGADGNSYQVTERGLLQYTPGNSAPFDIVILPRKVEPPEAA